MRSKASSAWGICLGRYPVQKSHSNKYITETIRSIHSTQPCQLRQRRQLYRGLIPRSDPPPRPAPENLDRSLVIKPKHERQLLQSRSFPIGSRRLRAALRSNKNIPFELLPYQCFQEARKVLQQDRDEKVKAIEVERERIEKLKLKSTSNEAEEVRKQNRLRSMTTHMEKLKILADINDPMVKKRFEDGRGDLNRPIYRFLAERKWRHWKRLVLDQRVKQMKLIPDVLPTIDITADIDIHFHGRKDRVNKMLIPRNRKVAHTVTAQPGEFVASKVSQDAPEVTIQVFDKGTRHVTIAIVDPDVPNLESDRFDYRCHYLAINIPISPTTKRLQLASLDPEAQVILPWIPPYSIKGAPYHRLGIFVLEQHQGAVLDYQQAAKKVERDGFKLRGFVTRHRLNPITATLFRTQWDLWMDKVMQTHGYHGVDLQFKRKRIEPLPYKKKDGNRFR